MNHVHEAWKQREAKREAELEEMRKWLALAHRYETVNTILATSCGGLAAQHLAAAIKL